METSLAPGFLIVASVIGTLIWLLIYRLKKHVPDKIQMANWAKESGFIILSAQRRLFLKGPFWQHGVLFVYRIKVRDYEGHEKAGWLRIEVFFFGPNPDVKWD